jgi:hypothetical protein
MFLLRGWCIHGERARLTDGLQLLDTTIGSGAEHVYPKLGYKEIGIVPAYGFSPKDGSLLDEIFFYKDVRQG